jgi:hypothetical protein
MVIKFVSIGMLSYLPRFVNSASTLSIKKRKVTMEFKLLTSVIMTYMNDCVLYSIISKEVGWHAGLLFTLSETFTTALARGWWTVGDISYCMSWWDIYNTP